MTSDGAAAKDSFARLRDSMQPRLSTLSSRLSTLPDKLDRHLDTISDKLKPSTKLDTASATRSRPTSSAASPADTPSTPALPQPPPPDSPSYDANLTALAERILFRSYHPDPISGGPLLILCAAAFPDPNEVDYNKLLPYVLLNIPSDAELADGGYSLIFFAGSGSSGGLVKEGRPGWAWTLQAYGLLGRAVRKKIRRLWVVHERAWVRVILELATGVVSPKFRKKIVHIATLTELAKHVDISQVPIPPAVYLHDRKLTPVIELPGFPPPKVFGVPPFHNAANPPRVGDNMPLPQVLVEATAYLRQELDTEGLFRVPASQAYLEVLRSAYDRRQVVHWPHWGVHTAAGLIKLYYRTLPEPCIPEGCYAKLMELVPKRPSPTMATRMLSPEEKEQQFEIVRELLCGEDLETGIPTWSRALLLRHLFPLLALVAERKETNKMTPQNLAVCIGGSLARNDDIRKEAEVGPGVRRFVELSIERIEELAPKLPIRRRPVGDVRRRSAEAAARKSAGVDDLKRWSGHRKQVPSGSQESLADTDDRRTSAGTAPATNSRPASPKPDLHRQGAVVRKSLPAAPDLPPRPTTATSTPVSTNAPIFPTTWTPQTDRITPRSPPQSPPARPENRHTIAIPLRLPPRPGHILPDALLAGPPAPPPPPHSPEPRTVAPSADTANPHPRPPPRPQTSSSSITLGPPLPPRPQTTGIVATTPPPATTPSPPCIITPDPTPTPPPTRPTPPPLPRRLSTSPFPPPPDPPAPLHRPLRRAVSTSGLVAQRRKSFAREFEAADDNAPRGGVRRSRSSVWEGEERRRRELEGLREGQGKKKLVRQLSLLYEERARGAKVLEGVVRRKSEREGAE